MSSTETPPSAKSVCVMGIPIRDFLRAFRDPDVAHLHQAAGTVENPQGLVVPARAGTTAAFYPKSQSQPDAWRMVRRRAAAAGIAAPIGCHTFRARA